MPSVEAAAEAIAPSKSAAEARTSRMPVCCFFSFFSGSGFNILGFRVFIRVSEFMPGLWDSLDDGLGLLTTRFLE